MKWVATREEMSKVGRRVLCAMYADTEYGFPVCGVFDGEYWIVDDVQQLIDQKRIVWTAMIAWAIIFWLGITYLLLRW